MRQEQALAMRIPFLVSQSIASTESNKTGNWSFIQPSYSDRTAPCSEACPCGTDIPRVEALLVRGRTAAAWRTILAENPLPGVCGRVCFHPCEAACNRGELDAPVSINALERALADAARENGSAENLAPAPSKGKRVAVLGSGPAGLSAAYFLALLGYSCEVFESESEPGGLLRWGIPEYRLPPEILREEIARLTRLGVEFHCGEPMKQAFLSKASGRYAAVVLACGFGRPMPLGIPGEELALDGLALLRASRQKAPASNGSAAEKPVALVIGGGNTAVDAARTLLRMGKQPVIVYRRRRADMPAFDHEVTRALEEGVRILELRAPLSLKRDGAGLSLELQLMRTSDTGPDGRARSVPVPGQTERLAAAEVYTSIGAAPEGAWLEPTKSSSARVNLSRCVIIPGKTPVAFTGDLSTEEKSVTDAIASGKEAAMALDVLFGKGEAAIPGTLDACRVGKGTSLSMEIYQGGARALRKKTVVQFKDINSDYFPGVPRQEGSALPAGEGARSFREVEGGLSAQAAVREAERCFNCGTCNNCDNCRTFCPDAAIILEGDTRRINTDYCKGCGVCVTECPRFAMTLAAEGTEL